MKKIIGSCVCLLMLWLGLALAVMILELLFFGLLPESVGQSGWSRGLELSVNQIPVLLAVWLTAVKMDGFHLRELGITGKKWILWLTAGGAAAFVLYLGNWYLSVRLGYLGNLQEKAGWNGNLWFYLIGYFLVALGEECMCRGYVQELVRQKLGVVAALILPTVLFSLLHVGNYGNRIGAYLSAWGLGFFMAVMRYTSGSLWMPIGFHWLYNWLEVAVLGIEGETYSVYHSLIVNEARWDAVLVFLTLVGAAVLLIWKAAQRKA